MQRKVLLIEDNQDIAQLVKLHLTELSCQVTHAENGITGLALAQSQTFDLLILDIMLPGIDGLEICRKVRSENHYAPILMLTAKSSELDRVLGLEMGADDYLTKPFSVMELRARVKAIFRRMEGFKTSNNKDGNNKLIRAGKIAIDSDKRTVELDNQSIELTAKEFDLLLCFAQNPGRVYTRAQLLDQVWGYTHSGYEHTVNSHINRLRAKIEANPNDPEYIQTVWGVGYKFAEKFEHID